MIATIVKRIYEDAGFKIGVLGTSITISMHNLNEWITAIAGIATTIYTVMKCIQIHRDEKRKSKKD